MRQSGAGRGKISCCNPKLPNYVCEPNSHPSKALEKKPAHRARSSSRDRVVCAGFFDSHEPGAPRRAQHAESHHSDAPNIRRRKAELQFALRELPRCNGRRQRRQSARPLERAHGLPQRHPDEPPHRWRFLLGHYERKLADASIRNQANRSRTLATRRLHPYLLNAAILRAAKELASPENGSSLLLCFFASFPICLNFLPARGNSSHKIILRSHLCSSVARAFLTSLRPAHPPLPSDPATRECRNS